MKMDLADQLPACLAEDPFLRSFIGIFDEVADTVEMQVANLDHLVDVAVAPDQMLQWLGHFWLDVYLLDPSMPIQRRRRWVREMGRLLWLRGTAEGLVGLLEQITGRQVEIYDSGGVYPSAAAPANPHHVEIWVDDGGLTTDEHLLDFVHRELPAEVTFELQVGERVLWPPAAVARRAADHGAADHGAADHGAADHGAVARPVAYRPIAEYHVAADHLAADHHLAGLTGAHHPFGGG